MASCSTTKNGILFIYEDDGYEWAEYLKKELKKPAYSIPSISVHWQNVAEDLTSSCTVHILILTPEMEQHVSKIKYELLNYFSPTSLVLECNVDSSKLQMIKWAVTYRLEDNVENQRNLLTTIIQAYETAENDAEYDDVLDVNVVPATIFPGQKEIFIVFNLKQNWISVKMEGVKDRIRTRKYSDFIFGCQLCRDTCGQKMLSVYKEDSAHPIYKTPVTIVTVNALLQNLVDNLESAFGTCCDMNSGEEDTKTRLAQTFPMGIQFNPFLGASDEILTKFAKLVSDLYTLSFDDKNKSDFSTPALEDIDKLAEIWNSNKTTEAKPSRPPFLKAQTLPEISPDKLAEIWNSNETTEANHSRPLQTTQKKKLFSFGLKKSNAKKDKGKDKNLSRRVSRRMVMAMNQKITNIPKLPKHTEK